jgi:tetratricopeptide (TPR) repeat protein
LDHCRPSPIDAQFFLGEDHARQRVFCAHRHEFIGAQRALAEAEDVSDEQPSSMDESAASGGRKAKTSRCYGVSAESSECSGVLAFYLAALEQRTGNYARAESEYKIATKKLDRAAPYINLAELYALECDWKNVLLTLKFAVWADPSSVAALATRSQYEYECGDRDQSQVDLERAESETIQSAYDQVALSRALHQRSDETSKRRGIGEMRKALQGRFEKLRMFDTQVELATWLLDDRKVDASIDVLSKVISADPDDIKANYALALAYDVKRSLVKNSPAEVQKYSKKMKQSYLRALSGRAFTDEDYTTQGNAAFELNALHEALALYGQAIRINPHAVYALSGRANVYKKSGHYQLAVDNYNAAVKLLWMALNKSANPAASLSPATFVAAAVSERGPAWLTAG